MQAQKSLSIIKQIKKLQNSGLLLQKQQQIRINNLTIFEFSRLRPKSSKFVQIVQEKEEYKENLQKKLQETDNLEEKYGEDEYQNQIYIKNSDTKKDLLDLYTERKTTFNIVNQCTFLHKILKIQFSKKNLTEKQKQEYNKNPVQYKKLLQKEIIENDQIFELIQTLKKQIPNMDSFSISNYISNLAKLEYFDQDIVKLTVQNPKIELFNMKAISYVLWAMVKFRVKDDQFLKISEELLLKNNINKMEERLISNLFYALGFLNSKNDLLFTILEQRIFEISQKFESTQINMILQVYSQYGRKENLEIVDALTQRFLTLIKKHSMRNIANMVTHCSLMDYINHNLFNAIESELLHRLQPLIQAENQEYDVNETFEDQEKRLKAIEQDQELILQEFLKQQEKEEKLQKQEEQDNILQDNQGQSSVVDDNVSLNPQLYQKQSKVLKHDNKELVNPVLDQNLIYDLSPWDASQIIVGFCKLKIIKTQLFEVLEYNFIKKLDVASTQSIVTYAFAHSSLCTQMLQNYHSNTKQFTRRSLKNLKKYNHNFYEIVTTKAAEKIESFNVEELLSFFTSASRPLVKKRAICRQLVDLGVKGVFKLNQIGSKLPLDQIQQKQYEYFRILSNFCYGNNLRDQLINEYKKQNIDIDQLFTKYGYIAPKVSTEALPEFNLEDLDFEQEQQIQEQKQKEFN